MKVLRRLLLILVAISVVTTTSVIAMKDNSPPMSRWLLRNIHLCDLWPVQKGMLKASIYFDEGNPVPFFLLALGYARTGDFKKSFDNYRVAFNHHYSMVDLNSFAFVAEKAGKCHEFRTLVKAAGRDQANCKHCQDTGEEAR